MEKNEGDTKKLEGIKGWLLVFVILFITSVIGDIHVIVMNVILFFVPSNGAISVNPTLIFANIILTSILVILEILILILIFKKKQKAIRGVIVTLTYLILYASIWHYFITPLPIWIFLASVNSIISILFILYFIKSQRVKNTLTR